MIPRSVIHLLSGGLDSTVLLYDLVQQGCLVHCLLFNYGQTHIGELVVARKHAVACGCEHTEVELHRIKHLFSHSALTDGAGTKIVPNRNAVFLHIAAAIAASQAIQSVTIACNKDDAADFPDCRWDFINAMNATLKTAEVDVEVCAPYIGLTKWQIVHRAKKQGWPYADTVSCYSGNDCGTCDACKKRKEAMA